MSSVYSCSTVTIAASGAIDGNSGCFLKPKGYIGKVRFETTMDDCKIAWDISASIYYKSVVQSHLADRAWSVQERLLSPRTLYFSKSELFWGCKLRDASESFPEGLPYFMQQHVFHLHKRPISEDWDTILKLYTPGKLTYSKDKLVAISGVTRAIQQETHDQYLAGL